MKIRIKFKAWSFIVTMACFIFYYSISSFMKFGVQQDMLADVTLVLMTFFLLKSFFQYPIQSLALVSLLLALTNEVAQFIQYLSLIELHQSPLAWAIMGNHYQLVELLAYLLGYLILIFGGYLQTQYRLWRRYKTGS
ncbi:DUF2809 domain-containing protein [Parashewanella spongiae]|uniref:DUF2809 domain-containing protein n=2 Tax=Parashewanella spongiae TaxID=342950 RepID=A0A3A6U256_9GAMM|nr:DUF2809 domain-containing protein [Parashewanella spongiae]RJY06794.1 DUF2809 domain-containing protein [Parashewanella spongiae]